MALDTIETTPPIPWCGSYACIHTTMQEDRVGELVPHLQQEVAPKSSKTWLHAACIGKATTYLTAEFATQTLGCDYCSGRRVCRCLVFTNNHILKHLHRADAALLRERERSNRGKRFDVCCVSPRQTRLTFGVRLKAVRPLKAALETLERRPVCLEPALELPCSGRDAMACPPAAQPQLLLGWQRQRRTHLGVR